MRVGRAALAVMMIWGVACGRPSARESTAASEAPRQRWGPLMAELARRFELFGRAAQARRYELAYFELDEIGEIFHDDLPRAIRPHDVDAEILRTHRVSFASSAIPALRNATRAHDADAIARAYAHAATICNGCHLATQHAFIEVSPTLGASVPRMDPLP